MKKQEWIEEIKRAAADAGTYKNYFDAVIDTLADILEKRDLAAEQAGEKLASGTHRNPLMVIWNDLNKSALAYWKELGLTPAGLKKLNEETFAERKQVNSLLGLLNKSKEE